MYLLDINVNELVLDEVDALIKVKDLSSLEDFLHQITLVDEYLVLLLKVLCCFG